MRQLDRWIGWIARGLVYLATAAGIGLTAFVALSAFMRYFVGAPFAFTEETVGLLFSAMVFLSLPYCTHAGTHIRVTLLTDHLPPAWQRRMAMVSTVLTFCFCSVYGYWAFDFAWTSLMLNAKSDIGRITLWPWMMAMPFACAVMGLACVLRQLAPTPSPADNTGIGTG